MFSQTVDHDVDVDVDVDVEMTDVAPPCQKITSMLTF
jgi:hypothetical protein